jgi:division protein CdvB (Snf7/Vps24/ESCRT-III family)
MSKYPPFEMRTSLQDTAYRLNYAEHVVDNEADEVESAITEEDPGHSNILILAQVHHHLSQARQHLKAAISLLQPKGKS